MSLFGSAKPEHRTLYYGDCLDWMGQWDDRTVDLIYLDPPFNSKANYNVLFRDRGAGKAQYQAFEDTWEWNNKAETRLGIYEGAGARPARNVILGFRDILGSSGMLAYLTYMAERLEQMKRLLKPTGAIYLHCDPTASHYLKVLMDAIFGAGNFRNEVVWQKIRSSKAQKTGFGPVHDTILSYRRSVQSKFRKLYTPLPPERVKRHYSKLDETGRRYGLDNFTQTGQGPPRRFGDRVIAPPDGKHWIWDQKRIDRAMDEGRLVFTSECMVRVKRFLDESKGSPIESIWIDVPPINSQAKERIGYPTQKPIALLERIIEASSNPGDIMLDPFCGCGTAVDAASRLGRRWVGIDISSFAIDLIRNRRMADPDISVKGMPYDLQSARKLAKEKPFDFESWAIMRMPGFVPNTVRVGDGGIDGRATLATKPADYKSRLAVAQVKGGGFSLSHLRDFIHVTDRDKAALGVYVTLDPVTSTAARTEAAKARTVTVGAESYSRCQLWPIADYFDNRRPHLPTMTDPYTGKPLVQEELFA